MQYFGICYLIVRKSCDPRFFGNSKYPVGSIMVVGALTHCTLLYFMRDLKDTQMNTKFSLIWEFMFYETELDYNTTEATINICWAKDEDAVNHSTISRLLKKFPSGQVALKLDLRLYMERNLVSRTWRVSGKLSISQSSVIYGFHDVGKSIQLCLMLQKYWFDFVLMTCLIQFQSNHYRRIVLVLFNCISTIMGNLMPLLVE